jgi:hypothetical protein
MGLLLFKFLPYIWPLLREFLEGKKDHPYFKDGVRAKSKSKLFAFILLLLLLGTGNWAYDLHGSMLQLEKKLAEAEKAPKIAPAAQYTREHLDLELCQRDQQDTQLQLKEQEIKLQASNEALKMCHTELEWERLNRPVAPTKPTNSKPKPDDVPVGDAVQKQLEELQKKEGKNNAAH